MRLSSTSSPPPHTNSSLINTTKDTEVTLDGFESVIVDQMLQFIYTDELIPTEETVVELLRIAGLYNLERMQSLCMLFIEQSVDEENVVSLLEVSDWYEALHLKSYCITFILKHYAYVLPSFTPLLSSPSLKKIDIGLSRMERIENKEPYPVQTHYAAGAGGIKTCQGVT